MGGSGAARLRAAVLSSSRAAKKFGFPSSDLLLSPPPTFRQVFPSSRLARMGGARRADLAGGSVRPLKVGEAFRTATPRRGGGAEGGLRKLLFL